MPFNVLLLPLLGGYLFLTHWNRTRFDTKRYSGERLIFHAAIAGVVFLILSFLVVTGIRAARPETYTEWRTFVPFPYTGTSFGAFLIGALGWWPLNHSLHKREKEQRRTIAEWGDHLEELLERAIRETKQVSVTMKSGKVYVGFVISNIDPSYDRKYLQILPISSGYRHPETLEVTFTTDYAKVYAQMMQEDNTFAITGPRDFLHVLPVPEIASANLFDPDAYTRFNAGEPEMEPSAE